MGKPNNFSLLTMGFTKQRLMIKEPTLYYVNRGETLLTHRYTIYVFCESRILVKTFYFSPIEPRKFGRLQI